MAVETGRWEVPADPHHVGVLRRQVAAFAALAGMASSGRADLQVAVSEALTNTVLHAYGEADAGKVRVDAEVRESDLVVRVRDYGRGIRPSAGFSTRGRGLTIIAALAKAIRVRRCEGGGTEVSMFFALARGQGARGTCL